MRPSPLDGADRGWSLPEVIVALLLGLLIVHLGLDSLSRMSVARHRIASRSDALIALRVGRHVLRSELRHAVRGVDWDVDADSMWLRAFRGSARVCMSDTLAATLLVSYAGVRAPDPAKDSVLLLTLDGGREARALVSTGAPSAACAGWDSLVAMSWRLDQAAPPGTRAARLFERGSYHLSAGALRYRRGASGRQPLTPGVLSPQSRWSVAGARVGVELVPADSLAGGPWVGFLAGGVP